MGGDGSTRWGNTPIRWQTGACLALEMAKIRPYLSGSQSLVWRWRRPPGDDATLRMETSREAVALSYTTQRGQGVSMSIREHIAVAWMPCTYGGERAWFTCPGCDRRAGALYLPLTHDRFRCRHCHKLAYGSQQVTPEERHWLRSRAIQRRLGADGAAIAPWHRPTRPKGMHARTYARLCDALLDHQREREAILTVQLRRLVARADRLRAREESRGR